MDLRRRRKELVRDNMNIWNSYDFAMSGLGKKSRLLAKVKHIRKCIKWSKQRITRGYADCDVWEMFSFLQTMIPEMLQTLKDTRMGSQKNSYDEEHSKALRAFHEKYGLFGFKLQTKKELEENKKRGGGGTVHFMDELPEYKEISDKYREEEKRLGEYRSACKNEAFDMMKQYFFSLWD